jgi:hypothetical protein
MKQVLVPRFEVGISHETLYRSFQNGRFSNEAKDKTLDAIAAYIGYHNWNNFQLQMAEDILSEREHSNEIVNENVDDLGAQRPSTSETNRIDPISVLPETMTVLLDFFGSKLTELRARTRRVGRWIAVLFWLIALLFCGYGVYFYRTSQILIEMIWFVNEREFNAYKQVPEVIDTTYFNCYLETSVYNQQLGEVVYKLNRRRTSNSRLILDISNYRVLEHHFKYIGFDNATVTTKEKWYLLWEGDDKKYDVENEQKYYFNRDKNGEWKIRFNTYDGKKSPI